ncbi:ZnF C2H2 [Geosmithia morbida]|uniref:ZnF C2H2 n=1 Tax=Geosmithia morbida TaxID=1094350 RepID=A0A9P4YTJ7_9HYPO|nr:ZnF C2H2 [Geosmithia morbida]KAF4122292.1 ZnF C2H2 [Geosmithia morbida]
MSARTAKLLGRKSSSSHTAVTSGMAGSSRSSSSNVRQQLDHRQSTETLPDDDAASVLTTNSAKQKGTFMCGFCREEGIRKTCTRKNDLKRHMEDFHSMNALWFCGQNGCGMVFDWPTVYKTHLKTAHGGSRVVPEDVKVTLCPQTVFACGFDRCIQVFESSSDADAPATFKEYVAHVVKHFDDGGGGGGGGSGQPQWSYSTRLRNLLRQSAVLNAWADTYPDADSRDLRWQPQTTGVLRKLLETRHVLPRNVGLLVRYAYALGSDQPDPSTLSDIHQVFRIPVSEECQLQIPGHRTMRQPSPMIHQQQQQQQHTPQHEHQQHQQHQQHQHQQQQMMRHQAPQTPQQPEQDQFSFKISRGNNPHPHLAHYYATQRRTFQTKPPVRAGRSARPPMLSQHQQNFPQQSQPQLPPQQAMFNPNNMGHGHGMWQQQQQQPYRQMMTLSDKGIIADDLRSLRSMASTSSGGSNGNAHQNQHHVDVDMADAHMMDLTAYNMSRISAATAYSVDVGLQSPASEGDCVKMEGHYSLGTDHDYLYNQAARVRVTWFNFSTQMGYTLPTRRTRLAGMFTIRPPSDDNVIQPLGDDDQRILVGLTHKYGVSSLMCALSALGGSSRASTISATTLLSSTSAPSLVWTASDAASIRTQSTREGPLVSIADTSSLSDTDFPAVKLPSDVAWLESPATIQSPPVQTQTPVGNATAASPRLAIPTLKKYQCPMCFLDRNLVEFGRKSDFKKHLNNFHGTDVTWICRTKGCHLSFATERAYSTHAKEAHKMDALPSSAARTELCPQLVFSCGFASCKDRVFEAAAREDAAASRDKYFEHIAKHFEDDFDVNDWEYRVQIQNLMRQSRVKHTWKTGIWPKERRQQLSWKPRSSGDLRRMLEARHLGDDISQLVRLAFILGTAPFTSSRTPPPSEIDQHFQLPFRSQCLLETAEPPASSTAGDDGPPATSSSSASSIIGSATKSRPQSMFRLSGRRVKPGRNARPSTPASTMSGPPPTSTPSASFLSSAASTSSAPAATIGAGADTFMSGEADASSGPHPGTPIVIPGERSLPADAPEFIPPEGVTSMLPKQEPQHQHIQASTPLTIDTPLSMTSVPDSPAMYAMTPLSGNGSHQHQHQHQQHHHHHHLDEPHNVYSMYGSAPPTSVPDDVPMSPYDQPMSQVESDHHAAVEYGEMMYGCTPASNASASTIRPATPVPHKRPVSWSRVGSMDDMRSVRRSSASMGSAYGNDSPMSVGHTDVGVGGIPSHGMAGMVPVSMDQIPNAYGEMIPPHPSAYHYQHHHHHHHQQQQQQQHQHQQAPTSMPAGTEWGVPMRMGQEPQVGYHAQQQQQQQQHYQEGPDMSSMTTFFFDDEGRL